MKRLNILFLALLMSFVTTSCFEDYSERHFFRTLTVEFDDAVARNNAPGLDFPLLPQLRNNAGDRSFRINLFGGLHGQDLDIPVRIVAESTTAVEGVHYTLPNGLNVRIPANEAFGFLTINIPELPNTAAVRLVFELQSTDLVNASNNKKRIGMDIRI
ncbi:DUF4843 domain-containing protein [Mongoliitalea lutea]|uniref:DUF1735 domain-containing protein n=1 Tax=Mongoliitalea lutea TaxID=849756 RepID=A0A8J3CYR0_9BACT|nr:DUF4843 domain-containing protein [Mongoliitalea lutea]GHB35575.1 hypothetical protein GCM10008106_16330 [Mongoliitalea lutea]